MKLLDLTHSVSGDMSLYPGTPSPSVIGLCSIERNGFCEASITLTSHTGTHIDAPSHMIPDGPTVGELPLDRFFGLAFVLDVQDAENGIITMEHILPHKDMLDICRFVIFRSGWDKYWGSPAYMKRYPLPDKETAQYLANLSQLSGVGTDTPSVDAEEDTSYPHHHILLGAGKILIENLCGLEQIEDELIMLSVLPLKYDNGDGSPVRAAAFGSNMV